MGYICCTVLYSTVLYCSRSTLGNHTTPPHMMYHPGDHHLLRNFPWMDGRGRGEEEEVLRLLSIAVPELIRCVRMYCIVLYCTLSYGVVLACLESSRRGVRMKYVWSDGNPIPKQYHKVINMPNGIL